MVCSETQYRVNDGCVPKCTGGKTRNAAGDCGCSANQDEVNGNCEPRCTGDGCVSAVNTDLANALSKAFTGAMGAEVKMAQEEARRKVDEALKPYRARLDTLAAARQAELGRKLKEAESRISGLCDALLKNLTPGKLKLLKFKL